MPQACVYSISSMACEKEVRYIIIQVSSDGLELVILASRPNASTPLLITDYPTAGKLNSRRGITVQTSTRTPTGIQRTRSRPLRHTREPSAYMGSKNMTSLQMVRSNCQHRPPPGIFSAYVSVGITTLRPTGTLPWPEAYAYRPILRHTHNHHFAVNSFTAQGAKRPGIRLPRLEAERAEHILNGLRVDEEEAWKEDEQSMRTLAQFRQLQLGSTANSIYSSNSERHSDSSDGHSTSVGLAIHLDISLDISAVKELPSSPSSFEAEIAQIEGLERMSRQNFVQRVDEWRGNVDIDGWSGEEEDSMLIC